MPVTNNGNKGAAEVKVQGENTAIRISRADDGIIVHLAGDWDLSASASLFTEWQRMLASLQEGSKLTVDFSQLGQFDSRLVAMLSELERRAAQQHWHLSRDGWPQRICALLRPLRGPGERDVRPVVQLPPTGNVFYRTGQAIVDWFRGMHSLVTFSGEATLASWRLLSGKSQMRRRDFFSCLIDSGMQALPIVSLISFLVGIIIALLGAVVLIQFGAEFAVAYLIGYGMLREMGAIMTGVIMSGRTGAAYAAQIGSMKINEELDALETLGIRTMDFVVMPRLLAMSLMLPMLTIYANVVGIFGGFLVAKYAMGVPESIFF